MVLAQPSRCCSLTVGMVFEEGLRGQQCGICAATAGFPWVGQSPCTFMFSKWWSDGAAVTQARLLRHVAGWLYLALLHVYMQSSETAFQAPGQTLCLF